jgi:hypothetical protein
MVISFLNTEGKYEENFCLLRFFVFLLGGAGGGNSQVFAQKNPLHNHSAVDFPSEKMF